MLAVVVDPYADTQADNYSRTEVSSPGVQAAAPKSVIVGSCELS
jgi:hypothetical protein